MAGRRRGGRARPGRRTALSRGRVFALVGLPGTGKYTVALALAAALEGRGQTARVVDNHYVNNPVFGVIAHDGVTPLPAEVWDCVGAVRAALLQAVERLSPPAWSFIFTIDAEDTPRDHAWVGDFARVAAGRGSPFHLVRLTCEVEELSRRVTAPGRREQMKSVSADEARRRHAQGVPAFEQYGPLTLDITDVAPAAAAEAILDWAQDGSQDVG